jgi:hypothetical protein
MDTVSLFKHFRRRKSGLLVGPSLDQIMFAAPHFVYHVWAFDDRGKLFSEQEVKNTVTREGVGYLLGCAFAVTTPPTKKANFYLTQYKSNTGQLSTMTASAPLGTEIVYGGGTPDVSQAARPVCTLGAISPGTSPPDQITVDNSANKAVFNHLLPLTVFGLQLFSVAAGGTSSGYVGDVLYGGTAYTTSLTVANGYEVDVQATIQANAG